MQSIYTDTKTAGSSKTSSLAVGAPSRKTPLYDPFPFAHLDVQLWELWLAEELVYPFREHPQVYIYLLREPLFW